MSKSTEERLKALDKLIKSDDFLKNRGLGNEVGYYIFDYNPKDELLVRDHIRYLENQNVPSVDGYTIQVFNLYKIMMELLESKKYVEMIAQWENKHDIIFTATRINRLLKMEEFDDGKMYFTEYIKERVAKDAVVILTGVGEMYPLIRAHSVLNKMHLSYTKHPVIMIYPGEYDRKKLTILNTNQKANYYRAFRVN